MTTPAQPDKNQPQCNSYWRTKCRSAGSRSGALADAGLLDQRRRTYPGFESQSARLPKWRSPVLIAVSLGGVLLGAGVLLFVAAHWDRLSPEARFVSVLLLVAVFHVTGALTVQRFSTLATTLHAVGTVCLGVGIFLAGQIFHLQEHWPVGVLLWTLGAWVAWVLLSDWPQAAIVALLTPLWLGSEWLQTTGGGAGSDKILCSWPPPVGHHLPHRSPAG